MSKTALITGITGQDGSYLAELLLSKGYKVHGIIRRVALEDETHRLWRIRKILNEITLHSGSLESYARIFNIILKIKDEVGIINVGGEHQSVYEFVSQYQKVDTTSGAKIAPSLQLNIEKLKELLNFSYLKNIYFINCCGFSF